MPKKTDIDIQEMTAHEAVGYIETVMSIAVLEELREQEAEGDKPRATVLAAIGSREDFLFQHEKPKAAEIPVAVAETEPVESPVNAPAESEDVQPGMAFNTITGKEVAPGVGPDDCDHLGKTSY